MTLSNDAAYEAAKAQLIKFAEVAPVYGLHLDAVGEAMCQAGLALMVRERGLTEAADYMLQLLSAAIREASSGH